jgi:hypothetical protein
MAVYGVSIPAASTTDTAAANVKSLIEKVNQLHNKLAAEVDQFVEPDDIETDDTMRNTDVSI